MTDDDDASERQREILLVVLKFVGVAIIVCIGIGLATKIVVGSLGLKDTEISSLGPAPVAPVSPLPTTALSVPTQLPTGSEPTPTGIVTDEPTDLPTGDLTLSASPVSVKPMERINLTGGWAGHDAMGLMVQRFEDGGWVDFGVQTQLDVGTFATYVETSHEGDNKFRVIDPSTGTTSNAVTVSIG